MTGIPSILSEIITDAIGAVSANPSVPLPPSRAVAVASAVVKSISRDPRAGRITTAEPKPWYASMTVWGVIVSSVLKVAAVFLPWVDPAWADTIVQYAPLAVSFVGDGLALLGRARAKQPLG